jgi:hypothetical protein
MSTNQSKDPAKFSNLGRLYREVEELRLQVRQAESAGGFEETLGSTTLQANGIVTKERFVSPQQQMSEANFGETRVRSAHRF